jgi:hypothetical protein
MLNFVNNKSQMITCKMNCVIQGIMPSHYLRSVNLSNYGLSHVPKSVTPSFAFTHLRIFG